MKKTFLRVTALACAVIMCFALFTACGGHTHTYENGVCAECGESCAHTGFSDGICVSCGSVCRHPSYNGGKCSVCGKECRHNEYADGVCADCGKKCTHPAYTDGRCAECGIICSHPEYVLGVCAECGGRCPHEKFEGDRCSVCGKICLHESYKDGKCALCGKACAHESFFGGACTKCGYNCPHKEYESGKCTVCGESCPHKNYVGGVCEVCGTPCRHNIVDGTCTVCGEKFYPIYEAHLSDILPKINIVTEESEEWAMFCKPFDMNDLTSKDDRIYRNCSVSVTDCRIDQAITAAPAQVKIRGNYTANYSKKPFRLKFDEKVNLLGLNGGAKNKSWVLLADFKDLSLSRNSLAFWLSKQIFGADGYYSSDFRQVELHINGNYWGVYLLCEQQQVDENRVNVAKPSEGDKGVYTGYMLEYDGYYLFENLAERFTCGYNGGAPLLTRDGREVAPDPNIGFSIKSDVYYDDVSSCAQTRFIRDYIENLYKICYEAVYKGNYLTFNADKTRLIKYKPSGAEPVKETVSKVLDIRSLADTYILNEIACDADISRSGFFMDVDLSESGDGLLRFEAPWDFDSAFGLRDFCASAQEIYAANCANPWLIIFINENWFRDEINRKWAEIKEAGIFGLALNYVDVLKNKYGFNYTVNYSRWGFTPDNELCAGAAEAKNQGEAADYLISWLKRRINFLDGIFTA